MSESTLRIDLSARENLQALHNDLADRYWQNASIDTLIADLASGTDAILKELFEKHLGQRPDVALFAVGGYGRGELHPHSDIDLLIVAKKPAAIKSEVERFLHAVFDLNLEVGHAVRDIKSCRNEAKADLTVATAMLERRHLAGDPALAEQLDNVITSPRLWPIAKFYAAKVEEQRARHSHYDDIEYNLEPNVKTSPGGLRDIQTGLWFCERHFDTSDPLRLVELGVLTEQEANWLIQGRRFIWWVRFGLHLIAGRKEDQLQFAHQRELAQRLGFVDTDAKRGVERFMFHYYRYVLLLTEVNDVLLQYFRETVLARKRKKLTPINDRFQLIDGHIEATSDQVFERQPSTLLEIFVIGASREDVHGVRISTIRAIRENLHLIDDHFRNDPDNARLFLQLLKSPHNLVTQLTRMRRYGVLGRYIPEFQRVIGQMQHDLFHIYTVDAHTMAVVRNMRLLRYPEQREAFPLGHRCVHAVPKIELLYLAGLFHDIGKGRGGDHSVLGAADARQFCEQLSLNSADTELVEWLVRKHLYMSTVSQRQDIYDPEVVYQFASEVKSEMRLDYLYALTVADVNATNPTLWNSWRATLLRQLYTETRLALQRGLESPADKAASIDAHKERAMEELLDELGEHDWEKKEQLIKARWATMGEDFFLRHTPQQTTAITLQLMRHRSLNKPLITIQDTLSEEPGEGATQIHLYTRDRPALFAHTLIALTRHHLSVVSAIVHTDDEGICFDTYTVLNEDGEALSDAPEVRRKLVGDLQTELANAEAPLRLPRKRLSRQQRELTVPTKVSLKPGATPDTNLLTIIANDRPGLLARMALIFIQLGIQVCSARIATLGERVEDTFVVQTTDNQSFTEGEATYTLTETLRQQIDDALRK